MKKQPTLLMTIKEKSKDGTTIVEVKRELTIAQFKEYMESLPEEQRLAFSHKFIQWMKDNS